MRYGDWNWKNRELLNHVKSMRLTQHELRLIGSFRKDRTPEWLERNHRFIYVRAKRYNKIKTCERCNTEFFPEKRENYCFDCSLIVDHPDTNATVLHLRSDKSIRASREAWLNSRWFSEGELLNSKGYLGERDGYKCYMI